MSHKRMEIETMQVAIRHARHHCCMRFPPFGIVFRLRKEQWNWKQPPNMTSIMKWEKLHIVRNSISWNAADRVSIHTPGSRSNLITSKFRERNTREIMMMYETSFATLSERFFKSSSWPPVEYIEGLVDHDHVFCLLYKVRKLQILDCLGI